MLINLPLKKLSFWQQALFATALLERMLPNYQMFTEISEFGDDKLLRNQLNLVWQWLDKTQKCKINIAAQLEKLELQTPDPEQFDSFGVFPAVDVCMALMSLLQALQDKELDNIASVSRLSENSVSYYVELLLAEESNELDVTEQMLKQHPLVIWEIDTQNELFDFVKTAPESKASLIQAKKMVLEEGLSNLGIEIAS